jgi:hypothetical protein
MRSFTAVRRARAVGRTAAFLHSLGVVLLLSGGPVEASCGSTSCFLITGTKEGVGPAGSLTVDLSFHYVPQARKLAGGDRTDEVLTPMVDFEMEMIEPDHHREISTTNMMVQADLVYSVSGRLAVTGMLPLWNVREHEHDDEVGTVDEHFTNADGTSGFGDVRLGVRGVLAQGKANMLVGSVGAKLPTGQYKLLDSEGSINEPSLQPGTGSLDGLFGLYYTHQWSPRRLEGFVWASYRRNGRNDLEYRMGDETLLSIGLDGRGQGKASWAVQINGRRTGRDDYRGEAVPSTGATYVNLTPGVLFSTGPGTSLYGFVQVPIYQYVNDTQLAPGVGLLFGVTKVY